MPSRRELLLGAAALAGGVASLAGCTQREPRAASVVTPAHTPQRPLLGSLPTAPEAALVHTGDLVLFQGDSITDAHRARTISGPNHPRGLGRGYAALVASHMLARHPGAGLAFLNRGVSGDTVPKLRRRWRRECLDVRPDLVSILIGVNDFWGRGKRAGHRGTAEIYHRELAELVDLTLQELPGVRLVLCEPFALPTGYVTPVWVREYPSWREAARAVARDRALPFVDFQRMFDQALSTRPAPSLAADGVHPTALGATLMAEHWCRVVGC